MDARGRGNFQFNLNSLLHFLLHYRPSLTPPTHSLNSSRFIVLITLSDLIPALVAAATPYSKNLN